MDPRFNPHNTHLENPAKFHQLDPQLRALGHLPHVHHPALLGLLPTSAPGIYTITGGRQIGKTTLLKQWMVQLLEQDIPPSHIAFLTGELIDDHHTLIRLIGEQMSLMPEDSLLYIIVDEITYVKDWDKGIKFLADTGRFHNSVLILTGSDSVIIKEARTRFPGRRGASSQVDYHLHPLSFAEVIQLKGLLQESEQIRLIEEVCTPDDPSLSLLYNEFSNYLIHGGYLTAINDVAGKGVVQTATLATYTDWIRGDFIKRNLREKYLRETLGAINERIGSQVTWNNLAKSLSIDHPQTIAAYIDQLVSMDVVFVQPALVENKLTGAPKKARKVHIRDPFIFHGIRAWLDPTADPYHEQIVPALDDSILSSHLAESCVANHFARWFPTFYIKGQGEVDIAYVADQRFWPIEVKWTRQIRSADLKQIRKYPKGRIWTRARATSVIDGIPTEPLPVGLLRLARHQL